MTFLALRGLDLSTVYMSTGITYVLVMLASRWILKEVIEQRQYYAVLLIISGVVVFNV
jgi:multidrug transporter EmrE-like cation transporter